MKFEIGDRVRWKKREYTVKGYAALGRDQYYMLDLLSDDGKMFTLRRREIPNVKPVREVRRG